MTTAWHEIVIHGHEDVARAFVGGVVAGSGLGGAVFARDLELADESLGERLRELFAAGSHHAVFAPDPLAVRLAEALERYGADLGLALGSRRQVVGARFHFRAEVYSRDLAQALRSAVSTALPEGVVIERLTEGEEEVPEAHGAELYAPMHEYTYRAAGEVVGPLPGVLEVRRRARERNFTEVGPVHLETRPLAA
jgi:hypothetical protein